METQADPCYHGSLWGLNCYAFIILEGTLVMNFRDIKVEINAGEMIVIPKGVEHKPSSENGYKALLIEPEGVPNTGDVQSKMTIDNIQGV
jgi:mannose-6-phosphate isomerase-like protein (cupin superfamily)